MLNIEVMTDPFSTAAGAVSIISVGNEVRKGLASYLHDLRKHDKDIGSLSEKIGGFQLTVEAIKDILPKSRTSRLKHIAVALACSQDQISSKTPNLSGEYQEKKGQKV